MKRLIKNQNIKFDTHQAGDGQEVNLNGLHLEKILHNPKGTKLKFHFFNGASIEKQNTNVPTSLLNKIQKEVSKALKNNKKLQNELGHKIINTLNRYRKNGINEKEAIEAAKNIASYFNLDEHFIRKTITYAKDSNKIS